MALEGAEETETFGHPTFRVSGKTFCVLDEYKGGKAIAVKTGLALQDMFLKDERFYRTPYIGKHGWVSLRIVGRLDWREVEDLVKGSYRLMARRSSSAARSATRR
jgi:predicted DNA-binding protein (MmcQ/YjbR family)